MSLGIIKPIDLRFTYIMIIQFKLTSMNVGFTSPTFAYWNIWCFVFKVFVVETCMFSDCRRFQNVFKTFSNGSQNGFAIHRMIFATFRSGETMEYWLNCLKKINQTDSKTHRQTHRWSLKEPNCYDKLFSSSTHTLKPPIRTYFSMHV